MNHITASDEVLLELEIKKHQKIKISRHNFIHVIFWVLSLIFLTV